MKKLYFIIGLCLTLCCFSCDQGDDIGDIFVSGRWTVVNYFNTTDWKHSSKAQPIYTSFEDVTTLKKLTISFEENGVFSGTLTNGGTITGTWEADGKNRTVFIDGKNIRTSGNLNGFDNEFVQILKDAAYYQGDSRNLLLAIEKRTYYVQLSHY